jgi:hypothetical protein
MLFIFTIKTIKEGLGVGDDGNGAIGMDSVVG